MDCAARGFITEVAMSTAVSVDCPSCRRPLKVTNPDLFGKKVKCPGCGKPFVLPRPAPQTADDEVILQLVQPEEIPFGTGARIVPDEPILNAPTFPGPPRNTFPGPPRDAFPPMIPGPPVVPGTSTGASPIPTVPESPLRFEPAESMSAASPTLDRLKKRQKRGAWLNYLIVGVVLCGFGGIVAGIAMNLPEKSKVAGPESQAPGSNEGAKTSENQPYSQARLEGTPSLIEEFRPTKGDPVKLFMMPSGVNMVIHLRPARLWSDEYEAQVFRASLTEDVTNWIAAKLKEVCRREPAQIEEATIGLILGARGTEPDVCAVVRLKQPAKMSDLVEEFKGTYLYDLTERPDLRLKVDGKHGYLIQDESTFAICPEPLAGEIENWIKTPNYEISQGMSELLEKTDRERLFTIVGEAPDMVRHLDRIFPEGSRQAVSKLFEWLGEDAGTVSWSVQTSPYFHSEIAVLAPATVSPIALRDRIKDQMKELPKVVWQDLCLKMTPGEVRSRTFIGRLPAMLEAFRKSTVATVGAHHVRLTTVLPAKAAPNLALAAMFTANEAARTDFTPAAVAAAPAQSTSTNLPESVVERMKLPVDAEFSRTPLEPALQYLCDEVKIGLFLDGDALKDAGYTKNMPQTFTLGKVPMIQSLATIVNYYQERGKEMVVSIDENEKKIIVTTLKFAEAKGLKLYPMPATPPRE